MNRLVSTRAMAHDPGDHGLPEEVLECLERYCDGRCPELAGNLFEALSERAIQAECGLERCTCASLLRHWFGVDRRTTRRIGTVPPRRAPLLRLVHSRSRTP